MPRQEKRSEQLLCARHFCNNALKGVDLMKVHLLALDMRKGIAIGIMLCFILSIIPALSTGDVNIDKSGEIKISSKIIDDNDLTLSQVDALNAAGMARGTNSNWSASGGSLNDDEIYEMVFDSEGNVVVCGTIYQASQFGNIQVYTEGEGDISVSYTHLTLPTKRIV